MVVQATPPMTSRERSLPKKPLITAPSSGSAGRIQRWRLVSIFLALEPQQINIVHIQGLPVAMHHDNDGQAHGCFRRRHDHHKEHKYLRAYAAEHVAEGHET